MVDPLDGTTNFVHRFPAVGVSVALVDDDRVLAGAIAAPFLGDVWHAGLGEGATWELADGATAPCRVSARDPANAVVATGFPFRRKERLPRYLAAFTAALDAFEDLRRPGAACLDLAWTACGVFDGFFELGLAPWDVAAGGLLVAEAGGTVTDWANGPDFLAGDILAGTATGPRAARRDRGRPQRAATRSANRGDAPASSAAASRGFSTPTMSARAASRAPGSPSSAR